MVDPYIAAQISARRSPSVVKIKLLNLRSNYPRGFVFAVEGDIDKSIYSHWIARVKPNLSYEFLVLKGKKQIRQLKNSLSKDLGGLSADVRFFVDRDFDDLTGFHDAANVFMLDRYSIENYLTDPETLGAALVTAYPCDGHPQIRRNIKRRYASDLNCFLDALIDLNVRIYIARRLGIDIDDHMPNSIAGYVDISLGNITNLNRDASQDIPLPNILSPIIILTLQNEFYELPRITRHRGKFMYKFFLKWIEKLAVEFREAQIGLFGNLGPASGSIVHHELSPGALAARSPLPVGLYEFLP